MIKKRSSVYVFVAAFVAALVLALAAGCSSDNNPGKGDDPPIVNPPDRGSHDPAIANTVWAGMNMSTFSLHARAFVHVILENGDTLNGAVFMDNMTSIPPMDEEGLTAWLATVSLDDVDVYTWRTAGDRLYLTPFNPLTLVPGREVSHVYDVLSGGAQLTISDGVGVTYSKLMDIDDDFDFDWLFNMFDPAQ